MKKRNNMPKKITLAKSLLLGLKMGFRHSGAPMTKVSEDLKSWSICESARELKFDKFIEICVDNNILLLVKEGNPPLDELVKAWAAIYLEYSEAIDNTLTVELEKKVDNSKLKLKIKIVETIIEFLAVKYNNKLVDILHDYGFKGAFDYTKINEYEKDLMRVNTQLKFWKIKVAEEKEFKGSNPTYEHFSAALYALSKHSGYEIRAYDISAFDFAVRYKNFIKELKLRTN